MGASPGGTGAQQAQN